MKINTKTLCWSSLYTKKFLTSLSLLYGKFRPVNKQKWIMRANLTTFIIFVAILQVSASGFAQKMTLNRKNISLKQFFLEVRKQTGYNVAYADQEIIERAKIDVDIYNLPLRDALKLGLARLPLTFSISDQNIMIVPKEESILDRVINVFSYADIRGMVVNEKGDALPGATVLVKGANNIVKTDNKGEFQFKGISDKSILVISYVGYLTREIDAVSISPSQPIRLIPSAARLAEIAVVSTGYQNIPVERATGSFSVIKGSQLENKLKPDLKAALEGQAAGMVISKEGNIEIRGVSTFSGVKTPLIIVDGYPIAGTSIDNGGSVSAGLESLNMDNIESITVLKDAVAASIYGSRSSNGVIVVTTKTARGGKLSIDYKGSTGVNLKPDLSYLNRASSPDYVDAEVDLYNLAPATYLNTYNNNRPLSRVQYLLVARDQGLMTADAANAEIARLKNNNGIGQVSDYLLQSRFTQQHNISFGGGTQKNQSNASIKYIDGRSNFKGTDDSRLIFDIKNDWKVSDRITVKLLANTNYAVSSRPVQTLANFLTYTNTSVTRPYDLLVDPATGDPQDIFQVNPKKMAAYAGLKGLKPLNYNPLEDLSLESTTLKSLQVRMGGSLNIALIPGLNAEVGGAWTLGYNTTRTLYGNDAFRVRQWYDDGKSKSNATKYYIPNGAVLDESRGTNDAYTFRTQINFDREFNGKHQVTSIAGFEVSKDTQNTSSYPTRVGYNPQAGTFSIFNYADYSAGLYTADMLGGAQGSTPGISSGAIALRDNRFVSFYANSSYEYDKRFVLSGSIRMDLTNFFGTDPEFRYKPIWSVGGVYKLGNEKFVNLNWLDKLNLRATYGINGNISLTQGPFLVTSPGSFSNYTGANNASILSPPNSSLKWEKTSTFNLGADISIFNRFRISTDYYNRLSSDLLAPETIDPTLGTNAISITKNIGKIKNTGIELTLDADILRSRSFRWRANSTFSYNKNKILDYNSSYLYPSQLASSSAIYRNGFPFDAQFSYRYAGLDNNGSTTYLDVNNKVINGGLATINDLVYSGTLRPQYVTALTNSFSYHSFDLSFMIIAKFGNILRTDAFSGSNYQNKHVGERWRNPGDELTTIYPKISTGTSTDAFYFPFSDVLVESANYAKLRDVTLGYELNKKMLNKIGLAGVKLYLQGRNLLMITANKDHRDPETSELSVNASFGPFTEQGFTSIPLTPEIYAGLSIRF